MNKLVFGCGYLGLRVARRWLAAGQTVHVVTRSPQRASELAREGLLPIIADVTDPASMTSLPRVDTVLFAVGFDRSASYGIRDVYVDGLRNTLVALEGSWAAWAAGKGAVGDEMTTPRFIYISSTGVYGQADGSWVDEQSPCDPESSGGKACLAAEQVLNDHRMGQDSIVLRLAGIYGPDRIPRRALLEAGQPIPAAAERFLNLIHVEDAARVVALVADLPDAPQRLLVADGNPVLRRDYYFELSRLLRLPNPGFCPPRPESPAAERACDDKRICNTKMLEFLAIELDYPTYREGLAASAGRTDV